MEAENKAFFVSFPCVAADLRVPHLLEAEALMRSYRRSRSVGWTMIIFAPTLKPTGSSLRIIPSSAGQARFRNASLSVSAENRAAF